VCGSSIVYSKSEPRRDGNLASPDDIYFYSPDEHNKAFEGSADDEFPGSGMGDGSDGDDEDDDTDGSGFKPMPGKPVKKQKPGAEVEEVKEEIDESIEKETTTEPTIVEIDPIKKGKITSPPSEVEIMTVSPDNSKETNIDILENKQEYLSRMNIIGQPGILAGIVGGAVVGLLCILLFVMFFVYRMRKKDEGSHTLHPPPPEYAYTKAKNQEFYA